ncbi:MAG: aminoglycoside phosphotransferase [Pseudonocardiaceae bacterium]
MSADSWLAWLHDQLKSGAGRLDVGLDGEPVHGLRDRSVGCPVTTPTGQRWLRVVTEPADWAGGPAWIGNVDANSIIGVGKPAVLDMAEWEETGRRVRAELMTLAPGTRISADMALRQPVDLDEEWWNELRGSLDALAAHPTDRVCLEEQFVPRRLLAAFGMELDPAHLTWSTAHGDVHWANLTAPRCWLLDWESWGTAPTGYDAALLLCVSLLQPEIAERVHAVFADLLDTPAGHLAQLLAAAKLLGLVEYGDHPDLAIPVHRHARTVVDQINAQH